MSSLEVATINLNCRASERALNIRAGSGDDEVVLAAGSSVARDVSLGLGNGDNSLAAAGSLGGR